MEMQDENSFQALVGERFSMLNTDINVYTTYKLAFPNDSKIFTEFILCEEHMKTLCSG